MSHYVNKLVAHMQAHGVQCRPAGDGETIVALDEWSQRQADGSVRFDQGMVTIPANSSAVRSFLGY